MSAIAYTSSTYDRKNCHQSGREIAWTSSGMFAEIVSDGFGRGGWVHLFRPRRGVENPIWVRSRTHAHEIVEMHAEALTLSGEGRAA